MLCHSDESVLKYAKVLKQLYKYKKIITYYVAIFSVRLFVKKFSFFKIICCGISLEVKI